MVRHVVGWRWAFAIGAALAAGLVATARAEDGWVGKRVITRYGTVLKVGKQVVDDEDRSRNLALGHERRISRIYRVERVQGTWLWLVAEGGEARGWVKVEQVIALDGAVAFFTNELRSRPQSPSLYLRRGQAWSSHREYDKAIADYSEAIRLRPQDAIAYVSRGNGWGYKKEYPRAVADYSEAIRLDPNYDLAYSNRGATWADLREFDKAIADLDQAIRINPGHAKDYAKRAGPPHQDSDLA
ncbi:MAG TPA: tetratricopeptide repeat protein [Isosphaeraceae bacterium]|jgi:hypothetical protein|nr:tetratricopeptide repeat protein [Isosphaeraceae bacterium]